MTGSRWERLAAATGIGTAVLLVVSNAIQGSPPKFNGSTQTIARYFVDHRTKVLVSSFLAGFGFVVLFLWFLGSLRSYLRRAEGGTGRLSAVVFAGGVVTLPVLFVGAVMQQELAFRVAASGDQTLVRVLFDLQALAFTAVGLSIAVLVGATAILSLRTKAFPSWYAVASAIFAVAFVVSAATLQESGGFSPGGAFSFITFIMFGVWLLVTSVMLTARVGQESA